MKTIMSEMLAVRVRVGTESLYIRRGVYMRFVLAS